MSSELLEVEAEKEQGLTVLEQAQALLIQTDQDMELAASHLKAVKGMRKQIEAKFQGPVEAAHQAHKQLLALRNEIDGPFLKAENMLRQKSGAFLQERERQRQAEIQRREAEARARAEAERAAAVASMKAEQEAEAFRRKEELAAARRAGYPAVKELSERYKSEALKAMQAVKLLETAPLEVVVPEPVEDAPKVKGVSLVKNWQYRLRDIKSVKEEFLCHDDAKIKKLVKALGKDAERVVGGIEVYDPGTISVR